MSPLYGAGQMLARHSFHRPAQRVTSPQSHSLDGIATVLTSECQKMFGLVAGFSISCGFELRYGLARERLAQSPAALSSGNRPRAFEGGSDVATKWSSMAEAQLMGLERVLTEGSFIRS
jgi:hypothetical protein